MNSISGIYQIQSKCKPERIYIGSSFGIQRRWYNHLCDLRKNKHGSGKLQNHYNKYGESDLLFSIILGCDRSDLLKIEQYFIDSYKPYFNFCSKAGNCSGRIVSEESREKNRLSHIGLNKGIKRSNETRLRISKALKGKKQTEEHRKNNSESKKGQTPWNKGVAFNEEILTQE